MTGVLVALADPTRRQLLDLLSAQGQATATTLAEGMPVSRQAVVKHLTVLDEAGLVAATASATGTCAPTAPSCGRQTEVEATGTDPRALA